jgi:hypothetical protein
MAETTELATTELQTALKMGGLPPSRTSPFAEIPPPAALDPRILSSLRAKNLSNGNGALTDHWRSALAVLASPSHTVSIFLGSADRWFAMDYYLGSGGMAGYAFTGADHRITFPCTFENLLEQIDNWLQPAAVPNREPFHVDLRGEELVALSAITDAYREEGLRAFLERRPPVQNAFSRDQLLYELQASHGAEDPRWLAGLLVKHAPAAFQSTPEALDAGAAGLAQRGWLHFEEDSAVLEPLLQQICSSLANINPYTLIGAGPCGAPGSLVLVLCTLQSFWTLEFVVTAEGEAWVRLGSIGGPALRQFFERLMSGLPKPRSQAAPAAAWGAPPPTAAPPPAAARVPASAPQAKPPAQARPQPPAPAPAAKKPVAAQKAQPRACSKCGKILAPGKAFCTACGTPAKS